jgi:hypothetical protein
MGKRSEIGKMKNLVAERLKNKSMMKYIITILLFFIASNSIGQTYQVNTKDSTLFKPSTYPKATVQIQGKVRVTDSLLLTNIPIGDGDDSVLSITPSGVVRKVGGGGGGGSLIPGGAFTTSNIEVGFNPCTDCTADSIIKRVWYGIKPPLATLTGGTTLELTASGTVSQTLNWGASRQSNTPILTSIVVAGVTQSFSQPAQPGTVSGTQNVSVPANTTTTYSNVVTAADAQTATATTQFIFLGKKYYGLLSDTAGITTGSLNATIIALTSSFASTKTLSTSTGSITGTKFWAYAYPSTLGDLSALSFNSIPALEAMNKITLSITNASGYTQDYTVYYNKQGQTVQSDISAQ